MEDKVDEKPKVSEAVLELRKNSNYPQLRNLNLLLSVLCYVGVALIAFMLYRNMGLIELVITVFSYIFIIYVAKALIDVFIDIADSLINKSAD